MATAETREALVEGALATLREKGYAHASAREIAGRAGCNQALIFYHFGSVDGLLLAALDRVAELRRVRYQALVDESRNLKELVAAARTVFAEDLELGHTAVLVEMITAAQANAALRPEVAARLRPWRGFAAEALRGTPAALLGRPEELAHGVVAMFLGLELLAVLDDDPAPADALFERAGSLSSLLDLFSLRRRS
ncbi:TetR/AcrR family transcriptional regulator [Streptacidiphilus pinicola]|uniref:TetR/AcrR family transcriptional regulator n=1 Tax=Streptacidiphilus pinicola TaxID=2219663 RepID=UPI001403A7E9|nr:TetR/AcrR family transcriptional regulator [Streptacidiphilus pinicola]